MDDKTRTALEGSIEKWRNIAEGTGYDHGPDNCPLCQAFQGKPDVGCKGCPVRDKTGQNYCRDTPYDAWFALHKTVGSCWAVTPEQIDAAKAELVFLKSLLPAQADDVRHTGG